MSASARRVASFGPAPTPSAETSTFSRTDRSRNARLCWKVLASPLRPRRLGDHLVISRSPSDTVPASGRSKPLRTLTSGDLPAPFGPISPTISPRCSSSVTPARARTPSNERETEEARSVAPGLVSDSACAWAANLPSDLRDDLGGDGADELGRVVLDLDHPVLPAEHRVVLRREADETGDGRHLLERLRLDGEGYPPGGPAGPPDADDDPGDHRRPGEDPAGPGLHLLD